MKPVNFKLNMYNDVCQTHGGPKKPDLTKLCLSFKFILNAKWPNINDITLVDKGGELHKPLYIRGQ